MNRGGEFSTRVKRRREELEQIAQESKLTRANLSKGINILDSEPHYRTRGGMQSMDKPSNQLWEILRLKSS
jgi:hypothetical protein